jgi:hypothetical protein
LILIANANKAIIILNYQNIHSCLGHYIIFYYLFAINTLKMKRSTLALAFIVVTLVVVSCSKDGGSGATPAIQDCSKNPLRMGTRIVAQSYTGAKDTGIVNIDTIVNGKEFFGAYSKGFLPSLTAICVDASGNVYQYSKGMIFYPDGIIPITKPTQGIGQSVYSDTLYDGFTGSYGVYESKLLTTSETITVGGKSYSNGKKMISSFNHVYSPTNIVKDTITTFYYYCGLGIAKKEQNGTTILTYTDYTY